MIFKKKILFWVLIFFSQSIAYGQPDEDDVPAHPYSTEKPLFVSLGSHCGPAHILRFCEMREAAFPLDWIISFDGEALIIMLKDDFRYFLNDQFFLPFGPAGHLLNTHYHLEFLHEGDFNGEQYFTNLQKLKTKYQKRIERFRQLRNYPGKIFFIRAAYVYSTTDPHRYYKFHENLEITNEYASRLHNALKEFFPKLNFSLIIVNNHDGQNVKTEKQLSENILFTRDNPLQDPTETIASYKAFFTKLLEKELAKE